ncbi:MAG: hypothetical protein GX020_06975 [Firmicutes bacterium]|nr:hypothetical protein [Bacillota bacterium]
MRKRLVVICLIVVFCFTNSLVALATPTMSWNFKIFNNFNARQVALNLAIKQQELSKTTKEASSLDRFKESLQRMAMNKAIRDILYYDPDSGDPGYGFLPIDDGWIYYEWDSINQTMRLFLWQGDGWTEIFIGPEDLDPSDPPDPPILN